MGNLEFHTASVNEQRLEVIKRQAVEMKKQLKDLHRQATDLETRIEEIDMIIVYRLRLMKQGIKNV